MDYKGKNHSVLETLKRELAKGFIEKSVEVSGHKFILHTLNEDAETWADSYIRTNSPASIMSSRKAPRLAVAIWSIDGVPVSEMFSYPDGMPSEVKKALDENPVQKKFWIRDQMLYFLAEDGIRSFIDTLFSHLQDLETQRDEAVKEVPKS